MILRNESRAKFGVAGRLIKSRKGLEIYQQQLRC